MISIRYNNYRRAPTPITIIQPICFFFFLQNSQINRAQAKMSAISPLELALQDELGALEWWRPDLMLRDDFESVCCLRFCCLIFSLLCVCVIVYFVCLG
jgi:hypothetical protein